MQIGAAALTHTVVEFGFTPPCEILLDGVALLAEANRIALLTTVDPYDR